MGTWQPSERKQERTAIGDEPDLSETWPNDRLVVVGGAVNLAGAKAEPKEGKQEEVRGPLSNVGQQPVTASAGN